MDEPCAKKKKVMTITLQAMSAVTSPMYALVASIQNPENIPKTLGFGIQFQYQTHPKENVNQSLDSLKLKMIHLERAKYIILLLLKVIPTYYLLNLQIQL